MVSFSLEGKVALVTGAAYGIGLAIAKAYAEAGAKIVFNCSRQETVDRGLAAYRELGIDAKGYVCDVTDEADVRAMVADIKSTVGTIDILVNNAGIIKRMPMEEMAAGDFRKVIDIDLVGPFICSKAVIPGMIRKGHGKIINICSMMSELGRETVSSYAAAKGGLKMLTRNICAEYGGHNIQCNGIGPGYVAIVVPISVLFLIFCFLMRIQELRELSFKLSYLPLVYPTFFLCVFLSHRSFSFRVLKKVGIRECKFFREKE